MYVVLAMFLIYSCGDNNPNGTDKENFKISGNIKGASGKTIILTKVNTNGQELKDTAVIAEDGKFEISSSTHNPEFYSLEIKGLKGRIMLLVDSADNVIVNSDATDFIRNYSVEGSKDSKLIQELNLKISELFFKLDSLGKEYGQANAAGDETKMAQLQAEYIGAMELHKQYLRSFIDANKGSMATIWAIMQSVDQNQPLLTPQEDKKYYVETADLLMKNYPKSSYVQQLKQQADMFRNIPSIGEEAPEIALPNPNGETLKLSSLRGNYILLDFWASWCRPCRGENPNVVANYWKYKSKGFTVFQVSLDKTKEEWLAGIKADRLGAWHHVSELQHWNSQAAATYGVQGIPASFLINPEGKIIALNLRGAQLGNKLKEIYGY